MFFILIFSLLTEQWERWGFLPVIPLLIIGKWCGCDCYSHVTDNESERQRSEGLLKTTEDTTGQVSALVSVAFNTLLPAHGCKTQTWSYSHGMERQEGGTVSSKFVQSQFAWVHFKNSGQEWVPFFFFFNYNLLSCQRESYNLMA